MKKNEKGILAVETSIVLTFCVMLILFLFSFARVYSAQSTVSHAVIQASDAVALESYIREICFNGSEEDVVALANRITGSASLSADSFISLRDADVATLAKEKFTYAIAKTKNEADEKLKQLGVKNGLAGVDFSASSMDLGNDDVVVYVTYTIEMQFPILGLKDIPVTKAAKSKTFGDILFGIETLSEDPNEGSASGGGSYKHGTQVQITATPKYGYEFTGWTDGSSANPRTVTVAGAATYIATFRAKDFGVNLEVSPAGAGTLSGGGTYKYLDSIRINAVPAEGYSFKNWSIYRHEDKTTTTVASTETPITVNQTYTCTANFKVNSYTVSVRTEGIPSNVASIIYNGGNKTSVTADYKTALRLSAPTVNGYKFLGWKEDGTSNYFNSSPSASINVPAKNITYVACYESTVKTVQFYDKNGQLYCTRTVNAGNSLGGNMPENPKSVGSKFAGWQNGFSASTVVYDNMNVSSNWTSCSTHRAGNCGVVHTITAMRLNSHTSPGKTYECQCIVCADCGSYLNWIGGRYVTASGKNWAAPGGTINISPALWCYSHKSPYGNCSSYMNSHSAGVYNPH